MTEPIKLPPIPKGDIASDTCPVMWVHSHKQLTEYAKAAIEAALASPEVEALRKDSERLEFLIAEECQVKTLTLRKGKGYRLYWPDLEETQVEWFTNPRAAIDAAM